MGAPLLEHIKKLLELVQDPALVLDERGRLVWANALLCAATGRDLPELEGSQAAKLILSRHGRSSIGRIQACLRREGRWSGPLFLSHRDGTSTAFEARFDRLSSPAEDGAAEDWTIGVGREAALAGTESWNDHESSLQKIIAWIPSFLIAVDPEGRIRAWNNEAAETFGFEPGETLGSQLWEVPISWNHHEVQEMVDLCRSSRDTVRPEPVAFTRREEGSGFLGLTLSPIERMAGAETGVLIMGRDITERKQQESLMAQTAKLESIGQLAAGIAHEINTPTQFVSDNTRFLRDTFADLHRLITECHKACGEELTPEGSLQLVGTIRDVAAEADLEFIIEEIPKALEESVDGLERISKIVRAMKEFSHPGQDDFETTDLNKALLSTITVSRNEWKYVADLETDLAPSLPAVTCFPGEVNQVFLNMIVNSAHAIEEKIDRSSGEKGLIKITTDAEDNNVVVRISDTGGGIPPHVIERIFDPFFTTKEVGRGTGQGLSIAHNVIVERHGGLIEVDSQPGEGTNFTVRIPIRQAKADTTAIIETKRAS